MASHSQTQNKKNSPMEWTLKHSILLCREVLTGEPFKYKKGSNERGKIWSDIAETLNNLQEVKFKVTQRGFRERLECLKKKYKEKMREEEAASGISPDENELDTLLEDIIEREKVAEESRDSEGNLKKADADKQTAAEMRKEAMERFGETRKRSEDDGDQKKEKRRRRSACDTVEFLREKTEKEIQMREQELALKKEHQDQEAARQSQLLKQQSTMFEAMQKQQSQMQNMQMAMLQQQQRQSDAMISLLGRVLPQKP